MWHDKIEKWKHLQHVFLQAVYYFCSCLGSCGRGLGCCSRRTVQELRRRQYTISLRISHFNYFHLSAITICSESMGLLKQHAIQINCSNLHNVSLIIHAEVFSGLCNPVCVEQIRFIASCGNLSMFGNLPSNLFIGKGPSEIRTKGLGETYVRLLLMLCRFNEITLNTILRHYAFIFCTAINVNVMKYCVEIPAFATLLQ